MIWLLLGLAVLLGAALVWLLERPAVRPAGQPTPEESRIRLVASQKRDEAAKQELVDVQTLKGMSDEELERLANRGSDPK